MKVDLPVSLGSQDWCVVSTRVGERRHQTLYTKADAWKAAMAEEAEVAALRVKAEGGDARAMRKLGASYRDGTRGLKKDLTQAFMWLKRAADLKDKGVGQVM